MYNKINIIAAAVPIVLCNLVAIVAQYSFFHAHLPSWGAFGAGLYAAALESIAVYLAYQSHLAQLANDTAMRLRLTSYAYGLVVGAMNYSHYASFTKPNAEGLAVGIFSASSPFLWAVYTRRTSRDKLAARGLIEGHFVRLGTTRVMWHPIRSAQAFWIASWDGTSNPGIAINNWRVWVRQREQDKERRKEIEEARREREETLALMGQALTSDSPGIPDDNTMMISPPKPDNGQVRLGCGHLVNAKTAPRLGDSLECHVCRTHVPYVNDYVLKEYK